MAKAVQKANMPRWAAALLDKDQQLLEASTEPASRAASASVPSTPEPARLRSSPIVVDDDNKDDVDGQGDDNDDVDGEADDHVDGEGGEPSVDGDSGLALVKREPHAGDKSKPCEASYFVGWHDQQEAAWRAPATNPSAYEYTKDVRPGDSDMAPCVAHWPDGFRHELSGFTTVSWQTRQQAASKGKRQTSHFCRHVSWEYT